MIDEIIYKMFGALDNFFEKIHNMFKKKKNKDA